MLNIIGKRNVYFTISAIAVGVAIAAIALFGFKEAVDFSGGTLWQFRVNVEKPVVSDIKKIFQADFAHEEVAINYDSQNNVFLARLKEINEVDHQRFLQILNGKFKGFQELSFQSIGPSIGGELRKNAVIAMILALIGISLYIAYAFRKASRPISSWKYGVVTLLTLFHDVAIPAGLLAFLGYKLNVEIDGNFVVALLVVVGFSVHDTIVVFDRIRENLILHRDKKKFSEIINESVNQTLARSINTSFTLILVLVSLYFVGPINLHYFILTLIVGVTTGIYSSIFIASPGLLVIGGKSAKG
ncbi:MAG: protein translocase subunit SecF [Patescibacteria group bacterium]